MPLPRPPTSIKGLRGSIRWYLGCLKGQLGGAGVFQSHLEGSGPTRVLPEAVSETPHVEGPLRAWDRTGVERLAFSGS